MITKNCTWIYISEKDVKIFDSAFWRTTNLFCHKISSNLICPIVNNENEIHHSHKHTEYWNPKNEVFSVLHETDMGFYLIQVLWKKLKFDEDFVEYLINLVFEAHELAKKNKTRRRIWWNKSRRNRSNNKFFGSKMTLFQFSYYTWYYCWINARTCL